MAVREAMTPPGRGVVSWGVVSWGVVWWCYVWRVAEVYQKAADILATYFAGEEVEEGQPSRRATHSDQESDDPEEEEDDESEPEGNVNHNMMLSFGGNANFNANPFG